jgi:hypothetical protein
VDDGSGRAAVEEDDFDRVGALSDGSRDAGSDTPGYGDVASILIESDGTSARVVVEMAGRLPDRLVNGEIEGVGVDLFRESGDYQLFASGEPSGWYGYLYTPDGFVEYEGTFTIAGRTIIFVVPWSALGGDDSGTFSAFVDWTGSGPQGKNPYSQDLAPDDGTANFNP